MPVELVGSLEELVATSRNILSAVWPNTALDVAKGCAHFMSSGQLFMDVNAVNPRTTRQMAEAVQRVGASFVQLSIIGPIPDHGIGVPMLAGGDRVEEVADWLNSLGMQVRAIGSDPERPAALKLLRGLLGKGFTALLIEVLTVAQKYGLEDEILGLFADKLGQKPFVETAKAWICSMAPHAERRSHEMTQAIEMFADVGAPSLTIQSTRAVFEDLANRGLKERFGGEWASSYKDLLKCL